MEETVANRSDNKETKPEVSLPGSDINSIEQPAILQVLNPLNTLKGKIDKTEDDSVNRAELLKQSVSEEPQSHNDVNDNENAHCNENLVSHSNLLITTPTPTPTPTPSPTKDCEIDPHTGEIIFPETFNTSRQDNILDLESHLIEAYDDLFPKEESVGINELSPIADELQFGCSKIETKDNVRTVIEIEPAEVVAKKPVEKEIKANVPLQATQIVTPTELSNVEQCTSKEDIEKEVELLIENNKDGIIVSNKSNSISLSGYLSETNKHQLVGSSNAGIAEVRPVNENLVTTENLQDTSNVIKLNSLGTKIENFPDSNAKINKQVETTVEEKLSEVVNQQLLEVNSILDSQIKEREPPPEDSKINNSESLHLPIEKRPNLKVVSVPLSKTASEEEERKLFIDSLPPLEDTKASQSDAEQIAVDCKREYYQSLKKYLVQSNTDKPPLPLQTYRWEDLRRAKERGGYPWTHLYKRPLGPDEQPEIVLMLRKSQEIRFTSESPKSNKKVRIDDHVSIQETERYIKELSEEDEPDTEHIPSYQVDDIENHSLHSESFSFVSDSALTTHTAKTPKKSDRFSKVRRLFRRRRYGARRHDDAQSLPDSFTNTSLQHSLEEVPQGSQKHLNRGNQTAAPEYKIKVEDEPIYIHSKSARCFSIMKKLKCIADRQKKRFNIRRIHLTKEEKIVLSEEPKILKLKNSPKSQRGDIPHFIEKQDSDDVLEIVELEESPSRRRKDDDRFDKEERPQKSTTIKPEEIIDISDITDTQSAETVKNEQFVQNFDYNQHEGLDTSAIPPKKAPRLRREHVYEEIERSDETVAAAEELKFILDATAVDAIKQSLTTQDNSAAKEVNTTKTNIPLDRMGSSEEESISLADHTTTERKSNTLLAPISSIDSASSDDDKSKSHLQPVTEEETTDQELDNASVKLNTQQEAASHKEIKTLLKKEASPAPSEKKVTFSHVEDEAEPHREDIELTAEQLEATKAANQWKNAMK